MADSSNINPSAPGPKPTETTQPGTNQSSGQGWNPKPMTWLGMHFDSKQTKQLWTIISENIGQQINNDKAKAIKAIKKLGKDDGGESDPD